MLRETPKDSDVLEWQRGRFIFYFLLYKQFGATVYFFSFGNTFETVLYEISLRNVRHIFENLKAPRQQSKYFRITDRIKVDVCVKRMIALVSSLYVLRNIYAKTRMNCLPSRFDTRPHNMVILFPVRLVIQV